MNRKEKILETALILFNAEGVERITTRHIASKMDISQGNLHYHYPNKNRLIEALYENFILELKQAERYQGGLFKQEEIVLSIKENYTIFSTYKFILRDKDVIWRRLPTIKSNTLALFEAKREQIKSVIIVFVKQGIFRRQISADQIEFLADQFIFIASNWIVGSAYLNKKENDIDFFSKFTFRIWMPYLSDKALIDWEKNM